jgi:mono/diheme cytochrome c family protein
MNSKTGADVVIAGTGIVGCLIAEQMLDAGLSVLMLEAGPDIDRGRIIENYRNMPPSTKFLLPDGPFPPAPWALHPTAYTGNPDKDYLVTSGPDAKAYQQTYVRYVGGSTWHWAGTLWRLYAPNITPSAISGIGAMSADELFRYLKFGKVAGKAQAGGEMALAVQLSFCKLSDADLHAMVSYLRSMPPLTDPRAKSKFTQGSLFTDVASFRGVGGMSYDRSLPGGAAQLFAGNCATCHGIAAQGSRDSYFPSLFHNSALAVDGGRNVIAAILFGISRSTTDGLAFMPGFGGKTTDIADLSDEQVAQLTNFLLQHYGDASYSVTPSLVKQVRNGQAPAPALMALVTGGEWVGGVLLLALVIWVVVRHSSRTFVRSQSS